MNAETALVPGSAPRRRPAAALLLSVLCALAFSSAAEAEEPEKKPEWSMYPPGPLILPEYTDPARISWRNGEFLTGEPAGAGEDFLLWKSELFTAPLRLQSSVIRRLDFPVTFSLPKGSFSAVLTDGSHLTGDLEAFQDDAVILKTAQCGTVALRRDHIVRLERLQGGIVTTGGPQMLPPGKGGRSARHPKGTSPTTASGSAHWFVTAAGRTATPAFEAVLEGPVEFPGKCRVELLLHADAAPEFNFKITAESASFSVETWGDELVLTDGDAFASAGPRIGEQDKSLHLRVTWDRAAGKCALHGPDGALWAELSLKVTDVTPAGDEPEGEAGGERLAGAVNLQNKGAGLTLERFRISEWNGAPLPALRDDAACVETLAEVIPGEAAGLEGDALLIRLPDGTTRQTPLESVLAIRWPRAAVLERDPNLTEVWFAGGTLLRGRLLEVREGRMRLQTAFAAEPVTALEERCRALIPPGAAKITEAERDFEKLDLLTRGNQSLHGVIRPGGAALPEFQPAGAAAGTTLNPAADLTLTRSHPAAVEAAQAPVLLHLAEGQTLPVALRGLHRNKVEFTWDAVEVQELDSKRVRAAQFTAPSEQGGRGFSDPGWRMTGDGGQSPAVREGAVLLNPGAGLAHPHMLLNEDISFRALRESGTAMLRVRLFCSGAAQEPGGAGFLMMDTGGGVYCGLESSEGQMESQTQVPPADSADRGSEVRITLSEGRAIIYVNGVSVAETKRDDENKGSGIIIETASVWGNQMGSVRLTDFSTRGVSFLARTPPFASGAKREALLLPRLRREDPPRQVLIGRNGDLLRGEIEASTATHLLFRSGLETFKVPLERVAVAVWVTKAKEPETKTPAAAANKTEEEKPAPPEAPDEPPVRLLDLTGDREILAGAGKIEVRVPDALEAGAGKPAEALVATGPVQWLDLTNGGRLSLSVEKWEEEAVTGQHPMLGRCRIPFDLIHRVFLAEPPPVPAYAALSGWELTNTADPVPPEEEGGNSPLAGKPAPDFEIPLLTGDGKFSLQKSNGKVVVLDFWATWCGPCVKSLPDLIESMTEFPADQVEFIAVNQAETKEQIERFLQARNLKMTVALDADQGVARKYGVEGIPHTVIIGRDSQVAFVKTGYSPEGGKQIAEAVRKALQAAEAKPAP